MEVLIWKWFIFYGVGGDFHRGEGLIFRDASCLGLSFFFSPRGAARGYHRPRGGLLPHPVADCRISGGVERGERWLGLELDLACVFGGLRGGEFFVRVVTGQSPLRKLGNECPVAGFCRME